MVLLIPHCTISRRTASTAIHMERYSVFLGTFTTPILNEVIKHGPLMSLDLKVFTNLLIRNIDKIHFGAQYKA